MRAAFCSICFLSAFTCVFTRAGQKEIFSFIRKAKKKKKTQRELHVGPEKGLLFSD